MASENNTPENNASDHDVPPGSGPSSKTYTSAGVADLVFLIDVTGSMQPCLDALKNNIKRFIDIMTTREGNNMSPVTDWRARVVGYRDVIADGPMQYGWLNDHPFTSDKNELKAQLDSLFHRGGGDEPESLLDAMMLVATAGEMDLQATGSEEAGAKWRPAGSAARIIIVFTDATYHETMSIPGFEGATVLDLYNVYKQKHIKPYFFVPSFPCYVALGRFKGAIVTSCGEEGGTGLLEITKDDEKFMMLLDNLAKGVSQSASSQVRTLL